MDKRKPLNEGYRPQPPSERRNVNDGYQPERSDKPRGNPPTTGSGVPKK